MIPVVLPQLSISMEEGTVLSWLVEDGAEVAAGQPLVEVETDKATIAVEAPAAGTLRIVAAIGAVLPVDGMLAEIWDAAEAPAPAPVPGVAGPATAAPPPGAALAEREARATPAARGHIASPAARRLARQLGLDPADVAGSGPGGRVLFADVERAAQAAAADAAPAMTTESTPVRAPAGLRDLVVASISASWREIPHVHIAGELEAGGLAEARRLLKSRQDGLPTTVTDLLVLAVVRALRDVPDLNGALRPDGAVERSGEIHLGLAVATAGGVVAPVLRAASGLSLEGIARERRRLVDAARSGALDKRDLAGATCTLSNLGAYPVDFFAPVISGPQICLVAVGRLIEKPVAVSGSIVPGHRLWVNAAIDHRGADGEAGGRFLAALEKRLADLPAHV